MNGDGSARRGFVGRRDAIAALTEELRAAASSSRIVWIEGEAGIGKSTLMRRFVDELAGDHRVVWAGGAEEEQLLPFGLVASLLTGLGTDEGPSRPAPAAWDTDPLAVGAQLLGTLGEIAGTTVVVVDDLHWADAQSASALLFALRRVEREALLTVLATRPDPAAAIGDGWSRLLRDEARVRRVGLEGLRAEELVELAELTVGARLGGAGAERLHAHTGGHPMHARALLEELGPTALQTVQGVLPAPRSLATVVLAKVAALPTSAQDLVGALAVLGSSSPLPDVAAVGAVRDPLSALEAALGAGLVEQSFGGDVRFVHPLVRGAVYNDMSPTRRRDLHVAAAAVTSGLVALDHRVAATAGPEPDLAAELETLGVEAINDGRVELAEKHLEAAARLWVDAVDRDRCVLLAVEAVSLGGDLSRLRSLRPVVEACGDTPQRSYVLGGIDAASGRLQRAEDLMADAMARLDEDAGAPDGLNGRVAAGLATVGMVLGHWDTAIAPARLAVDRGEHGMAPYALAMCLSQQGRLDEVRALANDLSRGDDPQRFVPSGVAKLLADDLGGAVADLTAGVRPDSVGRSSRLLVLALSLLSDAHYRLGEWDDAVVQGELAVSLGQDRDQILTLQQAHPIASYAHAGRGDFGLAQAHVDAAAGLVELMPTWSGAAYLGVARAVLAQARGDRLALREAVSGLLAGSVRAKMERSANWMWRVLTADALLGVDELADARRTLEGLDALITRGALTSAVTDAARLRGQLAEAIGDVEGARAAYAAGLIAAPGLPLPTARLEITYARLLRQLSARRAAIEQLRRARHRLVRLGAKPLLAWCDEELAACGVAAPRGSVDRLGLTAAELPVAHLVAQGLSNRETAERLYVSVKAVEYHLGHIYAKLGISSRRQLAGRLTEPPEI
jgi:ATP/maltotriose-dependent transcriptional regulator MalT